MPVYLDDVRGMVGRLVEAIDDGDSVPIATVQAAAVSGELRALIERSGTYPISSLITPADWDELTTYLADILVANRNSEGEHFYVSNNGYCLLVAVLMEVTRFHLAGSNRPFPPQ